MNNQQLETAKDLLQIHFGHQDFRLGQEDVIKDLFAGHNSIVIMPTGGGKSLCYQLPALCFEGVTLVVSPLIALMKDQVDSLLACGVPTTFINSSLSLAETTSRINEIKDNRYKIIYIAPERFYNMEFVNLIKQVNVSLLAIDEAHCISQWGHDFRPSYTKIKDFIAHLNNPRIIALTATATPEVKEDIIKQLNLTTPPKIHITGFNRPNLHYHVFKASDYQKMEQIINMLQNSKGSAIIYANTRNKVDSITNSLLEHDISAIAYHAGMESDERTMTQESFMNDKTRVIVATNAFGMGIDKKDIRFVIHFDMPGTMEAYYQEAGRAGRDGKTSHCILFYHPSDRYLREFFINCENPSPKEIKQLYQLLLSYDQETIMTTYADLRSQIFTDTSDMTISNILKILEKYNIIKRPKEKQYDALIKFVVSDEEILKQIGTRAKAQIAIIQNLSTKYGAEINEGAKFNIDEFIESNDFTKATFTKTINSLKEKNLVEYTPPFRGTEINIIQNILADQLDNIIDFEAIRYKKDSGYEKLDYMESYAVHNGCRRKHILKYFGDDTRDLKCGACDYCLK
jgi:ATP-dependent DNA helicase RecQ